MTAGRMGNLTQALKMIMEGLGDVNHAIDFCKEQNDEELWENLISYSIDRPSKKWLGKSLLTIIIS